MKEYDVVIGLEIHVQLKTESKMFCASSAAYFGQDANTHVCPVCLGLPGALPVPNEVAIENATKVGLALNCTINLSNKFDRKSYFYPDLPKGYQISQFDFPIAKDGWLLVGEKKIRVNRAHMEEDTGKLTHSTLDGERVSLIDFNRSGVPLLEIVSEPDISSSQEAKAYAKKIHQTMRYLGVADVDMEKAGMRFDANVSIKPRGEEKLGTKVEIKNINSFSFLEKAINFEVARQTQVLAEKGTIVQETRGWVESKGETVSQRSKETSPDYRYFPDPDLPPLELKKETARSLKASLPELPDAKFERFQKDYTLTESEAKSLTETKEIADWFEKSVQVYTDVDSEIESQQKVKRVANWVINEIGRYLNENGLQLTDLPLEPAGLVEILVLIDKREISNQAAKTVFDQVLKTGKSPLVLIDELSLRQISDSSQVEKVVDEVLTENSRAVTDFKAGKGNTFDYLLGQVMRKAKGSANPQIVREVLTKKLS